MVQTLRPIHCSTLEAWNNLIISLANGKYWILRSCMDHLDISCFESTRLIRTSHIRGLQRLCRTIINLFMETSLREIDLFECQICQDELLTVAACGRNSNDFIWFWRRGFRRSCLPGRDTTAQSWLPIARLAALFHNWIITPVHSHSHAWYDFDVEAHHHSHFNHHWIYFFFIFLFSKIGIFITTDKAQHKRSTEDKQNGMRKKSQENRKLCNFHYIFRSVFVQFIWKKLHKKKKEK